MKHVSYANKTVFVDDATADALMEYAGLVAAEQTGDTVTVRALGQDGNEVDASFVLNVSTSLIAESTNSSMQPPSNPVALAYLQERIKLIRNPPNARLVDDLELDDRGAGGGRPEAE